MQISLPRRGEIIRAARILDVTHKSPGYFDQEATTVFDSFEAEILIASSSFTALLSDESARLVRFKIVLEPTAAGPDYEIEIHDDASVDLVLHRLPKRLVDAPAQFKLALTHYVCGVVYLDEVMRRWPEHKFGPKNPSERFMIDALSVPAKARAAARGSLWN